MQPVYNLYCTFRGYWWENTIYRGYITGNLRFTTGAQQYLASRPNDYLSLAVF